jgi:hypothetical protein
MDELKPLADLAADKNIAIQTLSTMLYVSLAGYGVLGAFILYLTKSCREDIKHAWDYVAKLAEAVRSANTDLAIIKAFAESKNKN